METALLLDPVTLRDATGASINPSSEEGITLLKRIAKLLEPSSTQDSSNRQRVIVDNTSIAVTNTPVAGAVNMGNVVIQFGAQATAAAAGIDSRFFMMDTARTAYATGIRTALVWS